MIKVSAIFLALLIVPFTLCTSESLASIQNTDEGQEMLNTLLIESSLHGPNLDSATVRSVLERTYSGLRQRQNSTNSWRVQYKKDCKVDKKDLRENMEETIDKQNTIKRHLASAQREKKRKSIYIERAQEEYDNYQKFLAYIKANRAGWNTFYTNISTNFKKLESTLSQISATLRGLKKTKPAKGAAFIELPDNYEVNLAQIKVDFEGNFNNVDGLKPVVSNLLEIMQNKPAVVKVDVRLSLKRLVESLAEKVRDRVEQLEEENETQTSLFANLELALSANVSRSRKSLDILKKSQEALEKKAAGISAAIARSDVHVKRAVAIYDMRVLECQQSVDIHKYLTVKKSKLYSVVGILKDIVDERFPELKVAIEAKKAARKAAADKKNKSKKVSVSVGSKTKNVASGEAEASGSFTAKSQK